jgi:hypothetical protein
MRTTITLEDDVAAAVDKLRRERGVRLSEAINELVRRGLAAGDPVKPFVQRSHDLGRGIDVTNIGDAIETLDGAASS